MTNAEKIRSMNNKELSRFIRELYYIGNDKRGFAFCGYNLDYWLNSEYQDEKNKKYNLL